MRDDELDELLRDAALSYNTPPEPPREAMWEAISRARNSAAVVPIGLPRRLPRWIAAAAGLAAVLVAGIAIGRASRDPATSAANQTPTPTTTLARSGDTITAEQPTSPDVIGVRTESAEASSRSDNRRAAARRLATDASPQPRDTPRDLANGSSDFSSDGAAYRLAVVDHLTRTEVLLTSFRAQEHSGDAARVDAQFAALSRELLGTTRLLLATRRGDDPNITRLLQDLEYVLMQLSQYANDGRRVDLDALNQSMDKRNVIPKLRSNIPAGLSATSGT
jgi:hypothetical protein